MNANMTPASEPVVIPSERSAYLATLPAASHTNLKSVSWTAILAGLTAALALQVLFMLLGAGLGFAIADPLTDENPVADFGRGAVIIQGVSAVLSLWFGGWVAGRFTPVGSRTTGWLHGFCVWCAATVAGVMMVSAGAGWVTGGLSKIVGGGLSMASATAGATTGGVADMAKDAIKQSTDTLSSFTDEAIGGRATSSNPAAAARAKREIGMAVARLFNPTQQSKMAENRSALVRTLAAQAGMTEADANRVVTDWTASYDRMKADLEAAKQEAEVRARQAADTAASALAIFSLCTFVAFVIGAIAASYGGRAGVRSAVLHDERMNVKAT